MAENGHPDLGGVFGPKTGVFLLAMSGSDVWKGAGVPARDIEVGVGPQKRLKLLKRLVRHVGWLGGRRRTI